MRDLSQLSLEKIARSDFICDCGTGHYTNIRRIVISSGALDSLPEIVAGQQKSDGSTINPGQDVILLSEDINTRIAAGNRVYDILTAAGYCVMRYCFNNPELVACQEAWTELRDNLPKKTALLIAVGSGTLNDITKFVSLKTGIPFYIVGTAPSMDGYASPVAPIIVGGLKYTFDAVSPEAIIGDIDIIKEAPIRMMSAGFGDVAGKCVSICDWKLSNLINGEPYCQLIADTVLRSVDSCLEQIDGLLRREPDAVQKVMESLVLCGLMMNYAKSSRPASGSEHNLGHYFELTQLNNGGAVSMHGEGVAVSSVISCFLYRRLSMLHPQQDEGIRHCKYWNRTEWEGEMQRICPDGWREILEIEDREHKNQLDTVSVRLAKTVEQWDEILKLIDRYILSEEDMASRMRKGGAPASPSELPGVTADILLDAILYAKDVRYRYSALQLAWDLGVLTELAHMACKELCRQ